MFWTKKEEKGLPDLPPMKEDFAPKEEEDEFEIPEKHALPSFPDSPIKKGFSQTAIKEAVEPEEETLPEAPEAEPEEEWKPALKFSAQPESKIKDIFVKIEKFHTARRALQTARDKIAEMDALLKKIRETRQKEEQELADWEKEVESVKSKIEDVTKNIFEKIE